MAKIGTAHIEIKPVLNEEALDEITRRIEDAVAAAVAAGMARVKPVPSMPPPQWQLPDTVTSPRPTFTVNADT